ncbi:MAG: RdgB/HAM1 family non-canonical purine NTP pyrophosphatase [Peptoniphilus sp. oral taxon 375]|nr:RdgB/HAM1 family non-canonical purine NTP pyrophosphatase [Peptoniphilus sp. oral taxon 375]
MKKLILSTDNKNKVLEIKEALEGLPLEVYAKSDFIDKEIQVDEKYDSLEENARLKAESLKEYAPECFILADDTGLFVHALKGEPGVHSARYAGNHDDEANLKKVLKNLKNQEDRSAYFKTVFVLINPKGQEEIIEGVCEGTILKEIQGPKTFGYDPIFQPNGKNISFAEMTIHEKNEISHRGRALVGLREYFKKVLR